MENTRKHTRELLQSANLSPRKRFGQNFLVNTRVLDSIVEAAELSSEDIVLEIGAGTGALTKRLALSSSKVIAVELDEGLFHLLQSTFQDNSDVTLIHADILDLDLSTLIDEVAGPGSESRRIKVIGNLPYYITTPILMKVLEESPMLPLPVQMVLTMVQKEVGQRIAAASPGTKAYGALSIAIAYRSDAKILRHVPATSFYPKPKVDSVLIRLNVKPTPSVDVKDERFFFRVVRAAFQYRRKTLRNALQMACKAGAIQLTIGAVDDALQALGLDEKRRGETLSISEFAALANTIQRQSEVML
ncbi:16S rRNA (adenine(1518)-N(6)/adenine(1519)-N(6))-dimethyltransferase RsmA [Candidatus Poribacteria bacterium]